MAGPPDRSFQSHPVSLTLLRIALLLIWLAVLAMPGYVFFSVRGGLSFLSGVDFQTFNLLIFPLVGLYAFTLLWSQFVIGSARSVLRKLVHPAIITFHRRQGVLIFLLAWLHPTLRFFGIGLDQYFKSWNVTPTLVPYLWLGYLQLFLLTLTAGTALLRKLPWLKTRWHTIHYLNYAVFVLVWIHSWVLGSDVQTTNLRYLWYFFGLTAVASTLVRVLNIVKRRSGSVGSPDRQEFKTVASVGQVKAGQPLCAEVKGKQIAIFMVGGRYYAIDNVCSHAGGPLCEGVLEGTVIECPLHASRFDVTTGAVLTGPAHEPQPTYRVRISGSNVEVAV